MGAVEPVLRGRAGRVHEEAEEAAERKGAEGDTEEGFAVEEMGSKGHGRSLKAQLVRRYQSMTIHFTVAMVTPMASSSQLQTWST
jgi:hypothetical protein